MARMINLDTILKGYILFIFHNDDFTKLKTRCSMIIFEIFTPFL